MEIIIFRTSTWLPAIGTAIMFASQVPFGQQDDLVRRLLLDAHQLWLQNVRGSHNSRQCTTRAPQPPPVN